MNLNSLLLNRSTPLGQALVWGGYPGLQLCEQVSGAPFVGFGISGDQLQYSTHRGPGAQCTNNTSGGWAAPQNSKLRALTNQYTMVWIGVLLDTSVNFGSLVALPYSLTHVTPYTTVKLRLGNPASTRRLQITWCGTDLVTERSWSTATTPFFTLGPALQMYAIARNGSSASAYRDGFLIESGLGQNANSPPEAPPFNTAAFPYASLFNANYHAPIEGSSGTCFFGGIFNRELTAGEMMDLWVNANILSGYKFMLGVNTLTAAGSPIITRSNILQAVKRASIF